MNICLKFIELSLLTLSLHLIQIMKQGSCCFTCHNILPFNSKTIVHFFRISEVIKMDQNISGIDWNSVRLIFLVATIFGCQVT